MKPLEILAKAVAVAVTVVILVPLAVLWLLGMLYICAALWHAIP